MTKRESHTDTNEIRKDARELPNYSIPEAAHYLLLPQATLRSWTLGRNYPTAQGQKRFQPVLSLPDRKRPLLSFCNLAEAHVLSAFRREQRVPLQAIRRALDFVSKRYPSSHPLLDRQFETDGAALFIRELGQLLDVSAHGQVIMKEVVDAHLRRIERDRAGAALRLYPFTRGGGLDEAKSVVIDPRVSFGRPVLCGTRIPTATIAERYKAGDTIDELAEDYGRPRLEIEEAIRCELPREAA